MTAVNGKQSFDKLVVDGTCLFDEFEAKWKKHFPDEIQRLYALMNDVANLKTLPYSSFHPYDNNDPRGFEFKTKHLRVYCVAQKGGKIVVMGGLKSKQANNDTTLFKKYQKLLSKLHK